MLAELLFSLPASNGTLERVFSQVGVIKSNKRALLSNETLDDLLIVATDDLTLKEFSPDAAIDLWWKGKIRRPNQKPRKQYQTEKGNDPENTESDETDLLDNWDDWFYSTRQKKFPYRLN